MKEGFKYGSRRSATYLATTAEIIENENERIKRAKHIVESKQLGPRIIFIHEVFDEGKQLNEAMEHILKDFPALSREIVLNWYYAEKGRRTNLRERKDDDEER